MTAPLRRREHRPAHHIHSEQARRHLLTALLLILVTVGMGTLGYELIEGWNLLDSLYMTVITLATIGYGETHPLSPLGRGFTIVLILTTIGTMGYAVSTLAAFLLEGELNRFIRGRRMDKRIASMSDHIILCGAGHTGIHIVAEFHKTRTPFVVIERDAATIEHCLQLGDLHYLQGDATQDEILRLAGIERARALVTVLSEDRDNVFVVLTARSLNPQLRILARLIEDENETKLRKAGADEVVSPNAIGGLRMASVMLRPTVVAFLDSMLRQDQTLRLEQLTVDGRFGLAGKSLAQADLGRRTGLLVVAIQPRGGRYQFNPRSDVVLVEGDVLIVIGTPEQLVRVQREGLADAVPG